MNKSINLKILQWNYNEIVEILEVKFMKWKDLLPNGTSLCLTKPF